MKSLICTFFAVLLCCSLFLKPEKTKEIEQPPATEATDQYLQIESIKTIPYSLTDTITELPDSSIKEQLISDYKLISL